MRAVIVEIKDSFAAVLSEDGMVSKVKNRNYVVGQEIIIRNSNKYVKLAASAAAALVLFATPAWAYLTPYSYVSLDINPSFEFSINRFDRVLSVRAVNDDGEKIVENISISELKNKEIQEAVKNVLVELKEQGYIIQGKDGGVVVATSSKKQEKTDELSASLKTAVEKEVEFVAKDKDSLIKSEASEANETKEIKETVKSEKNEDVEINKDSEENKNGNIKSEGVKEVKEAKETKEEKDRAKEQTKEDKEAVKETKEVLKEAAKEEKEAAKFDVKVIEVSQDEVDEAKKHNVTPGKLNLVKKLEEVYPEDSEFDADEWLDKSVKEIMDSIKEYSKTSKELNSEQNKEQGNESNKEDKQIKSNKSNK